MQRHTQQRFAAKLAHLNSGLNWRLILIASEDRNGSGFAAFDNGSSDKSKPSRASAAEVSVNSIIWAIKKDQRTGLLGGTTGIRTWDTRIFSPLLYQLSYSTGDAKIHQTFFRSALFHAGFSFFLMNVKSSLEEVWLAINVSKNQMKKVLQLAKCRSSRYIRLECFLLD